MQDDISTNTGRQGLKSNKKSNNGKWVSRQDAEMDNEAITPSTLAPQTSSTPSIMDESTLGSTSTASTYGDLMNTAKGAAKGAYDTVVSRGSDLLSKVDLGASTRIVREYPIQAAVGGLIVGFLVGAAVFSRRE